jgi:hypothetical protein
MMSSLTLGNETGVAIDDNGGGFFNLPLAYVAKCFSANGCLLCCLGRCPSVCPILIELFDEPRADLGGLGVMSVNTMHAMQYQSRP